MKKLLLLVLIIAATFNFASAKDIELNHFVVKENPFAISEVAVVATDSTGVIQENVNGTFAFTLNGFNEDLKFEKGTAFYHHKIDRSTFLYVKHINDHGTHTILYYVYMHDSKLSPLHISWIVLLAIPLILILSAYVFKRFMIIAIIILIIFVYFNYHNGLSISTFIESIVDGLKKLLWPYKSY